MEFIIGTDIGTSGAKAIAFTTGGEVVANAYRAYTPLITAAGHHELDPGLLFRAVVACIQEVVQQTSPGGKLLGISFSSAMHGLLAVDTDGKPLTNMITWADLRSSEEAAALKETPLGKRIYERTGTPVHAMSPLCKLIWLKKNEPLLFAQAHKFISIKEYIFYKLFGQYWVDYSIASATGLFDHTTHTWYPEALAVAGITAQQLSEPIPVSYMVKGLRPGYADLLTIPVNTPFIMGASDGCLANPGSGAIHAGNAAVTVGTSGAVRMITSYPVPDHRARIFNYILSDDLYVTGGATNNGINILKWYAENFLQHPFTTGEDLQWFVQQAATVPAGADGLIFLPYVYGERSPVWDAQARGVFLGVHSAHGYTHFMRAIIEGINFALAQVIQSVQETVGPMQKIFASGGFVHAPLWVQWLADLLGKEIVVTNTADASAVGAAITGLVAVGKLPNLGAATAFIQQQAVYTPDAAKTPRYQAAFNIYCSLYTKLKDDFKLLHALTATPTPR